MPKEVNIHKTESLGMQLIEAFAEQIKGTIEVERKAGTTFKIVFEAPI